MTRQTVYGLCLSLAVCTSCNPDRIEGGGDCDPAVEKCAGPPDPTMPPGPTNTVKTGPGTANPFDPKGDGSGGVKTDKDGNIVLDPGNFGGSQTPIIWVANSGEGTVSKIDTRKMIEVARYVTFPGGGADPSRTTVGLDGSVVVANRASGDGSKASAMRIAGDLSQCVDRNGNGKIDTSENTMAGKAAVAIPWPAGQFDAPPDECVLWVTKPGVFPANSLPRAAGYDAGLLEGKTHVYVGLYGTKQLLRMDATTGKIIKTIDVSPAMPYGLVLDKNGDVWVRGAEGSLAWVQVSKGDAVKLYNAQNAKQPPCPYGIAADSRGNIYTAGSTCVSRFNPMTETWQKLELSGMGATFTRGLAIDNKNGVWIADTGSGMYHVDGSGPELVFKGKTQNLSNNNVGAAIDFDNVPWIISYANSTAYKVNPADYSVQPIKVGSSPYTYSDMTGYQLRNAGAPSGFWRKTFRGCPDGQATLWQLLDWQLQAPAGTEVVVKVRYGKDPASVMNATWITVAKIPPDAKTPITLPKPGGDTTYMQVEFSMRSANPMVTPILSGVSTGFSCAIG